MNRAAADALLDTAELVPALEGPMASARELERQLLEADIPVMLARPPTKACCAGGCGCAAKLQLLVREADVPKVGQFMKNEWLSAIEREGLGAGLVPLGVPPADAADGALACPACGFQGALVDGACGDCGLQLE